MMTKKDYQRAAGIASAVTEINLHNAVVAAYIMLFQSDSPSFDQERFMQACLPKPKTLSKSKK